jgi:D-glycero-alpha-D-manno-heptose-7-phosphate kinase
VLIVRSPVRLSFGGGGTDLPAYYEEFGGAVLSATINKYFYTILKKRTDGKIQIISSDLRLTETWSDIARMQLSESGLEIPLAAIKEFGCNVSADLFLASEIQAGTGLGSSASVCVGVLKNLATYLDSDISKYNLAERAFYIARNVLGKPVGKQDEYASAFGGLNYITFERDGSTQVQPLGLRQNLVREFQSYLMLFYMGASHDSWRLLHEQEKSTKRGTGVALEALHEIRSLAERMKYVLEEGNFRSFAAMLHEGWMAKKKISSFISNSAIDQAYEIAIENGAWGGKITGAGGGGFLLLFCEEEHQKRVRSALSRQGIHEMGFELEFEGAHVLVNDPFIDEDERCGMEWVFNPVDAS